MYFSLWKPEKGNKRNDNKNISLFPPIRSLSAGQATTLRNGMHNTVGLNCLFSNFESEF